MKTTLRKVLLGLVLGLGIGLVSTGVAHAAALEWNDNTTVTINSNNYTIMNNSAATSLEHGATTLTVTVPSGSTFVMQSDNGYLLNNDGSLTTTCVGGVTRLEIEGSATVVVTPDATTLCTPPSSSGSGGGGSSAPAAAPAPTPDPTPDPTPTSAGSAVHRNGTLILDNGTVYLVKDGTRVGFRNEAEYLSHGYNFSQVVPATAADLALPLSGSIQMALEGTLVLDASDGVTVYMVGTGSTKRGFTSEAVFSALGYNFADLPVIDLTDYPAGDPVDSSELAHPDGALVLDANDGTTVWWIRGNQRRGFESEAVFNTYGFSFGKIVPANAADMALAEGSLVKFRDGTLVLDQGTYYLISDGGKLSFASANDLTDRGYSLANVITGSLGNYTFGGDVE
jgi:hypothetical protein